MNDLNIPQTSHPLHSINQTWVCVLQTPNEQLQIVLAGHPRHLAPVGNKLLMVRYFADDLEAMGYRLLLQRMRTITLWNLIHRENPNEENMMDRY